MMDRTIEDLMDMHERIKRLERENEMLRKALEKALAPENGEDARTLHTLLKEAKEGR